MEYLKRGEVEDELRRAEMDPKHAEPRWGKDPDPELIAHMKAAREDVGLDPEVSHLRWQRPLADGIDPGGWITGAHLTAGDYRFGIGRKGFDATVKVERWPNHFSIRLLVEDALGRTEEVAALDIERDVFEWLPLRGPEGR